MRAYRSFDEFTREEIRPLTRVGFSIDEFEIDTHYEQEQLFDQASEQASDTAVFLQIRVGGRRYARSK